MWMAATQITLSQLRPATAVGLLVYCSAIMISVLVSWMNSDIDNFAARFGDEQHWYAVRATPVPDVHVPLFSQVFPGRFDPADTNPVRE